jgi:hypothetical protein
MVIKNDIRGLAQPKAPSLPGGPTAASLQQPTPNKTEPAVRIGISDAAVAVAAQNNASTSAAVKAHANGWPTAPLKSITTKWLATCWVMLWLRCALVASKRSLIFI